MAPKCVKCADQHLTKDCPHIRGENDFIKCCNCNGKHPASYKGCEKYPKIIGKKVNHTTTPTSNTASSHTQPPPKKTSTKTYANILTDANANACENNFPQLTPRSVIINNQKEKIVHTQQIQEITEVIISISEIKNLLGFSNIQNLINPLKELCENIKKTTEFNDRLALVLNFCTNLNTN